jgi:hypothetical protein
VGTAVTGVAVTGAAVTGTGAAVTGTGVTGAVVTGAAVGDGEDGGRVTGGVDVTGVAVGAGVGEGVTGACVAVHDQSVRESTPAVQLYKAEPDCVYPVLHIGVHVAPLARLAVHVPRAPYRGAVTAHGFGLHATVLEISAPAVHALVPVRVYPLLHVGVHELPLARLAVQSPASPFVGAADASHASALHTAVLTVSVPAEHDRLPDSVYPALHDGVHEAPLARLPPVHVPRPPFVGAETAQGFGVHAKSVPESAPAAVQLYEAEPDCVYPMLHVGVHVAPLARLAVHVPRAPFGGAVTAHVAAGVNVGTVGAQVPTAKLYAG